MKKGKAPFLAGGGFLRRDLQRQTQLFRKDISSSTSVLNATNAAGIVPPTSNNPVLPSSINNNKSTDRSTEASKAPPDASNKSASDIRVRSIAMLRDIAQKIADYESQPTLLTDNIRTHIAKLKPSVSPLLAKLSDKSVDHQSFAVELEFAIKSYALLRDRVTKASGSGGTKRKLGDDAYRPVATALLNFTSACTKTIVHDPKKFYKSSARVASLLDSALL